MPSMDGDTLLFDWSFCLRVAVLLLELVVLLIAYIFDILHKLKCQHALFWVFDLLSVSCLGTSQF